MRRLVQTIFAVLVVAAFGARPAFAGNIALTGHDDDFHCEADGGGSIGDDACLQLSQLTNFVKAGSALPLVIIDPTGTPGALNSSGSLLFDLTKLGLATGATVLTTASAVSAFTFDPTLNSALIVASDSTCGGCDDTPAVEAALAGNSSVTSFFNSGGGIFALTGANNDAAYYAFLPVTAVGSPGAPSSGYVSTGACGVTVGDVNGDATHNLFPSPSPFCVAESEGVGGEAVTLVLTSGSITTTSITTGTTAVPEPTTLTLLGLGMVGAAYRRRRRQ